MVPFFRERYARLSDAQAANGITAVHSVSVNKTYTDKQGQYLAFIHYYSKIHGCSPAEADMQRYFRVSPPTAHQVVLALEARGLIARAPVRPDQSDC